jgi:hypothetical protein
MQMFSQDQLLLRCAASPSLSKPVAECVLPQLLRVAKREETLRVQLWGAGTIVCCAVPMRCAVLCCAVLCCAVLATVS